ncbi:MAG: SH3 domain-containing protein [Beijerinckiaceae bacterium]
MKKSLLAAASALSLATLAQLGFPEPAQAQIPRGTCMVSDPTGTPLNVRRSPNGRIVGRVRNGQIVVVRGITRDDRGRPWALLFSNDGASIGYVFREYVSCRN